MRFVLRILLLVWPLSTLAQDSLCLVQSTNHGGGLFSYTFRRGDLPYVWGMTNGGWSGWIQLQAHGVLEVHTPPNWSHTITPEGQIRWFVTNGIVFLDAPVTFSIRSCLTESTFYPGSFTSGAIIGVLFEWPGYRPAPYGGYQLFDYVGPASPLLSIESTATNLMLRWPIRAEPFRLETTERLEPPIVWSSVTNVPAMLGSQYVVTLSGSNSSKFFRLACQCDP